MTDHLGNDVMKYRYDAFGGLFTGVVAPYNTHGYTGQSYDPTSGLLDYNARWYSAKVGRFTSKDTFQGVIGQPSTQNLYSYVSNNPINLVDPTGHWQTGDENLPSDTQLKIIDLTNDWFSSSDPDEQDRIHEEADRLRNGGGTSSEPSSGSGTSGGGSSSHGSEGQVSFEQILAAKLARLSNSAGPEFAGKVAAAIYAKKYANLDIHAMTQSTGIGGHSYPRIIGQWDKDNGLNWLINEAKIGWGNAANDEEKAYFSAEAAYIRSVMRNAGYKNQDIMQVFDPVADINQEMQKNHPVLKLFGDFALSASDYYFNGPGFAELAASKGFLVNTTGKALKLVPATYRGVVAGAFIGEIVAETLTEDLVVYRYWGDKSLEMGSHWYSPIVYSSSEEAKVALALPGINSAKNLTKLIIPKGTTILTGKAASQVGVDGFGATDIGGGKQIYLMDSSIVIKQ